MAVPSMMTAAAVGEELDIILAVLLDREKPALPLEDLQ
jgi:hypothetical protein